MSKTNFPAGDFLIRLKNAALASRKEFSISNTKLICSIAQVLEKMGYLKCTKEINGMLKIILVYKNKKPMISDIKIISKPGLRVYTNIDRLSKIKSPWDYIISTPQGLKTHKDALKLKLGGEVIAKII